MRELRKLCAVIGIALCSYASYAETVRAGLYESPRYSYKTDDGTYAGADIEYAYRIAQKAGFEINITLFSNEASMIKSLDDGSVDMLFDFGKTSDLTSRYAFSETKIGSSALAVYVKKNDQRFTYGDIEQLKDKTFGYERENHVGKAFIVWCKAHGFEPQLEAFADTEAVDKALDQGQIDAAVIGENGHDGYTTILAFSPRAYYIMFRKDGSALKLKVDSAMNSILAYDPLFEEKLVKKYKIMTLGATGFSIEEKKYLQLKENIRVAVIHEDQPYFYKDRNGSCYGIIPEYYKKIASYIGKDFSFIDYDSTPDAVAAVKAGKADVLAMFSDGIIVAQKDGLLLTNTYENVDSVLIIRPGMRYEDIRTIAVKHRSINNARQGILALLDARVIPAVNAEEEFALLRKGSVDAIICGQPTATWLLNQTNSSTYSTMVLSSLQFDLCGAVAPGNTILLSILDKAISITNYNFESIVQNNTRQEHTFQASFARIPADVIVMFALFMLAMIITLTVASVFLFKSRQTALKAAAAQADAEQQRIKAEAIERNAEEKNSFFSNISHDMRTPLNAIIGFTRLASSDEISGDKRMEYLKKAETSEMLLLDLINDTLAISKASSGKMQLRLQPCRTVDLIAAVTSSVKEAAEKKHITFVSDSSGIDDGYIAADKLNVEKIFLNLLANAVKYTPEGGHVWYTAVQDKGEGDRLDFTFTVRDDGIGISSEFLSHIYEPFSQEKRAGYESTGTGLGLSIVKKLVNLMDGTIDVQSEKDKGSTFTVHLSFMKVIPSGRQCDNSIQRSVDDLAGKRMLVCEDNAMNREIAAALLEEKGILVDTAENGQEGVTVFRQSVPGTYAAVLMDLRMPVKNGYEAAQEIRSLGRSDADTVPIIAMTADAFEDDIQKCIDAGMNGHIAKPVSPDQLYKTLAGVIL